MYPEVPWTHPAVKRGASPADGDGLFATQSFSPGELVIVWGGSLFTRERRDAGEIRDFSEVMVEEGLWLGGNASDEMTLDDYMNHSCDPTLWLVDAVTLVARRAINAGEELTADYATWIGDPRWVLRKPCNCGAAICRKRVTGNDWMLHELKRYGEHFSPYLLRRIHARSPTGTGGSGRRSE